MPANVKTIVRYLGSLLAKPIVRYWGFLLAKLIAVAGITYALLALIMIIWPNDRAFKKLNMIEFGQTIAIGVLFFITAGMVYVAILDQRYRCRVCLRRLRMPIETGSWSKMLQFGRPKIEYICVYGHGKLNIPEVQLSGHEGPEWRQHADIWQELCGTGPKGKDDRDL